MLKFTARAGMTIRASTGLEDLGAPDRMTTIYFNKALPGDMLHLLDKQYQFNVATYSLQVDDKYIYTYSYQPNQSWTIYNNDLSGGTYRQDDYIFDQPCYFRLCFKRADGAEFDAGEAEKINEIVTFIQQPQESNACTFKPYLAEECEKLINKIEEKRTAGSLLFALLTDTHYTVNGTWGDTLASLKTVHETAKFDGIIHLGDLTDGMVTAAATRQYAGSIIDDLNSMGVPLYITIGNHDTNYFRNNAEPFTIEQQCELYLSHSADYITQSPGKPWYYKDLPERGLRFIFLHSFDYTRVIRYVYTPECLRWLAKTLEGTPAEYDVIVFNHLAPLVKLQYWTNRINGCKRLVDTLEGYNAGPQSGKIIAFINGHNHTDQVYCGLSFPVVSIGCSKIEYFTQYKPKGAYTPERRLGDATQELWDALIVTPRERHLDFLRFGAGKDREVEFGAH